MFISPYVSLKICDSWIHLGVVPQHGLYTIVCDKCHSTKAGPGSHRDDIVKHLDKNG